MNLNLSEAKVRLRKIRLELEWIRCRDDFPYFCQNYWKINHPSLGFIPFELRDYQLEVNKQLEENLWNLVLKSRQVGFSELICAWVFHKVYFFDQPRSIIMVSRREDEAKELIGKIRTGFSHMVDEVKARGPKLSNRAVQSFKLDNGASITAVATKNSPARSRSAWMIVLDEWAFYPDPEEVWASVEPAVDIGRLEAKKFADDMVNCGGRICALSTANNPGDEFNQQWDRTIAGDSFWNPIFVPWDAVPERDQEWYDAKAAEMDEWLLNREYPRDPSVAFQRSGALVFTFETLASLEPDVDFERGDIALSGMSRIELQRNPSGKLRIWEPPEDQLHYSLGVDSCAGYDTSDYAVVEVVRHPYYDRQGVFHEAAQVAEFRAKVNPEELASVTSLLGTYYNRGLVVAESNTYGLATLNELTRVLHYGRVYKRKRKTKRTDEEMEEIGFHTTGSTKPLLIGQLRGALDSGELEVRSAVCIAELKNYTFDDNGVGMSGKPHDDTVMAIAFAMEGVNRYPTYVKDEEMTSQGLTFEDVFRDMVKRNKKGTGYVIGR